MGGTLYEDSPAAWLRSESLFIWLEASRPLTSPSLKVEGLDAVSASAASCVEPCFGQCYCFAADLSKPTLNGIRGAFSLQASGVDPEGKVLTASDSLNVTRLSWRRPLGQPIRATPAIGADGTVYVGTSGGSSSRTGTLFAISAGGQERWNKPLGRIDASAMVSAPGLGPQRVFVGSLATNGLVSALDPTGTLVAQCVLSKDADLQASPTTIPLGAAFYANKTNELIALRPSTNPLCSAAQTSDDVLFPDGLVATGPSVFFVDNKPNVSRYDLTASGWLAYTQNQWPGSPASNYRNRGLAIPTAAALIGAGEIPQGGGAVFQAAATGNFRFDYGFSPPRVAASAHGPVVASDGLVLVGIPTGIAAVSSAITVVGGGDGIANTPVLGEGGRLFALAENGALSQWSYLAGKPVRLWSSPLDAATSLAFEASPALDCARTALGVLIAGRPGVLYAAARSGTLYAVVVDARGIDVTAQWPKYQKDPRNSGSADTALQEFACP